MGDAMKWVYRRRFWRAVRSGRMMFFLGVTPRVFMSTHFVGLAVPFVVSRGRVIRLVGLVLCICSIATLLRSFLCLCGGWGMLSFEEIGIGEKVSGMAKSLIFAKSNG